MPRIALAAALLSLVGPTFGAQAATIDAAGAEALRTALSQQFDNFAQEAAVDGKKLTANGPWVIEPKGHYYAVTTPAITARTEFQDILELGSLRLNMMPGTAPGQWKTTLTIPKTLKLTDPKGQAVATMAYDTMRFAAIHRLNDPADTPQVDWVMTGITLGVNHPSLEPSRINVGNLTLSSRAATHATNPNWVSVDVKFGLRDIKADVADGAKTERYIISLGRTDWQIAIKDMDPSKVRAHQEKMNELTQAGLDHKKLSSPQAADAWIDIIKQGRGQYDGHRFLASIDGLEVTHGPTNQDKSTGPKVWRLNNLSITQETNNLRADKSTGSIAIKAMNNDLAAFSSSANPIPDFAKPLLPRDIHWTFSYQNFPHTQFMDQVLGLGKSVATSVEDSQQKCSEPDKSKCPNAFDGAAQMAMMQGMMSLPQILAQAGTVFNLDAGLNGPKLGLDADGSFTAKADAMFSGIGQMKTVITGADEVLADLQQAQKNSTPTPAAANVASRLASAIEAFGQIVTQGTAGKDPGTNRSTRTFDIVLDAAGQTTVNGKPFSAMANQGTAPSPAPEATPPIPPPGSPAQ